jgi:polyisoprenoid-binding protein YceI
MTSCVRGTRARLPGVKFDTCLLVAVALIPATALAQSVAIDTTRSTVTVRVYKSGLLSALAHNHVLQAPIASGSLDAMERTVELSFNVSSMKVVDPEGSDSERKEIEDTMKGPTVLGMAKFPVISFASSAVTILGPERYQVTGALKLHGASHQISFPVFRSGERYSGSLVLKQTDYGITPVKIAGGSVRVKDEVTLEVNIAPVTASGGSTPQRKF